MYMAVIDIMMEGDGYPTADDDANDADASKGCDYRPRLTLRSSAASSRGVSPLLSITPRHIIF
jgi:hypothetical protein